MNMALQLRRLDQFVVASFALIVVANLVIESEARYMPRVPSMQRRESYENDDEGDGDPDKDQDASASYQNQDDNSQPTSDGYEDPEADGPYEETPREQEGQADLERFFDDHLGASEKDGMDKENLPSNLVPLIAIAPREVQRPPVSPLDLQVASSQLQLSVHDPSGEEPEDVGMRIDQEHYHGANKETRQQLLRLPSRVETDYVRLPVTNGARGPSSNRLIITRQITSDPNGSGGFTPSQRVLVVPMRQQNNHQQQREPMDPIRRLEDEVLLANGSEVVQAEDEDMDRVYVTNMRNRRFRIPALGGYDPEEDFKSASRDIEKVERHPPVSRHAKAAASSPMRKTSKTRGHLGGFGGQKHSMQDQEEPGDEETPMPPGKDISFNDPEDEQLYNDASELDEVTFGPDDLDLEAEMRRQEYDKVGKVGLGQRIDSDDDGRASESNDQEPIVRRRPPPPINTRRADGYDDPDDNDESTWLNDGADEMEIPSQSHQDLVLDKAAKQEAQAKKTAKEAERQAQAEAEAAEAEAAEASAPDEATGGQQGQTDEEENSQRMPSAAYLSNDLKMDDTDYNN